MAAFFDETKFLATMACALLVSALLTDGLMLSRHMASHSLSIMTAYNAYASISILICACCMGFASRFCDARCRRKILELRTPIGLILGVVVLVVHICALVLPSYYQLSDPMDLFAEALVPLSLFLPLSLEACFASMLAWGAADLRQALCFPLAFLVAISLSDVYGIDETAVSFVYTTVGSALLVKSAHPGNDTFCARVTTRSSFLGLICGNRQLARSACSLGLFGMVILLSLAISALEFSSSAQIAVLLLCVLVYFYAGRRKARVFGVLVLFSAVLFMWLYGFEHERMYFLFIISIVAAFVHMEMGPKGLCLATALLLGGLGTCGAVHCSDQYYSMIIISYIAILLIVPLASLLVFCRPDNRLMIAWSIPKKAYFEYEKGCEFGASADKPASASMCGTEVKES